MAEVARFVDLNGPILLDEELVNRIESGFRSLDNYFNSRWEHAYVPPLKMDEVTNYLTKFWHDLTPNAQEVWLSYADESKQVTNAHDLYSMFSNKINTTIRKVTDELNEDDTVNVIDDHNLGSIFEIVLRYAHEEGLPLVIKDQHGVFHVSIMFENIVNALDDQLRSDLIKKGSSINKVNLRKDIFNKDFYRRFRHAFNKAVTETKLVMVGQHLATEKSKGEILGQALAGAQQKIDKAMYDAEAYQKNYKEALEQKERIQNVLLDKIQNDKLSYDELQKIRELQIKLQKDEKEYERELKEALDKNPTFSKNADSLAKLIDSIRETLISLFPYAVGGSIVGGGIAGGFILNSKEQEKYNITNDEFQKNLTKLNFKDPRMIEIREDFIKANEKELNKITNSSLKTNGRHRVLLQKAMSLGYLPKNVDLNQSVD